MTALDLPLSDSALMLQQSLQRYLAAFPRPSWNGLAHDLGLMSVGIPESLGGSGGGAIERATIMAELGAPLTGSDWLPHCIAATLIARITPHHAVLAPLARGDQRIALCLQPSHPEQSLLTYSAESLRLEGNAALVPGAAQADWLLIVTPETAILLPADAAGVHRRERPMLDGTRSADLNLSVQAQAEALLVSGEAAQPVYDWAINATLTGRCAEIAGLMHRMMIDTADYMGQRHQFGTPISRFQALRHRVADMQMAMMKAGALIERAVLAEEQGLTSWDRAVSAACVESAEAARFVGEGAVQMHGAMGLTEELALGRYYKRAMAIAAALGSPAAHLARHAAV